MDAADVVLFGDGAEFAARLHRQVDVVAARVETPQESALKSQNIPIVTCHQTPHIIKIPLHQVIGLETSRLEMI